MKAFFSTLLALPLVAACGGAANDGASNPKAGLADLRFSEVPVQANTIATIWSVP